jgi:hypothetical protein
MSDKTRPSDIFSSYIPVFLLGLALCLQGAKTPMMFFLWGSISLGLCLWAFLDHPRSFLKLSRLAPLGLFVCVMAAFVFSLDPSTSLFPTLQVIVFILTWLMLRSHPKWTQNKLIWRALIVLGTVTLVQTLHQISRGPNGAGLYDTYGFLPSNPSFNGIWMASLSVAFIAAP